MNTLKQKLFKNLRKLGFTRERAEGGSYYYTYCGGFYCPTFCEPFRVRISDHEVRMSDARQFNVDHGGFSWAEPGTYQLINPTPSSAWRFLLEVARVVHELKEQEEFNESMAFLTREAQLEFMAAGIDMRQSWKLAIANVTPSL